jgi:hypothetical protein
MSGALARDEGTSPSPRIPVRRAVAALLLLALAARVVAVLATPGYVPVHDDRDYDRLACWVARHGELADRSPPPPGPAGCAPAAGRHQGGPTAYRPPLWPLALGGAYAVAEATGIPRWTAGRLLQAAIGTAVVALAGMLALALCAADVALVTLALAALFLPLVLDGATLISEPLFVALELGSVLAVLRSRGSPQPLRWAFAAGLLAGLAALTRTTGLVLIPLVAAGAVARPHRLLAPAVLAAAAVLAIAPWTIRNAALFHAFVPVSTETGQTLLGTYNAEALGTPGCRGCWVLISDYPRYAALTARIHRAGELERDRLARTLAFDYVRAHPAAVPQVAAANTLRLFELAGAERTRFGAERIDVPPGAAVAGARQLWVVAALVLLAAVGGALRRAPPWLVGLVAVLFLTTVLVQSETPRFRAPLDPFLLILAASALCRGAEQLRQRALA